MDTSLIGTRDQMLSLQTITNDIVDLQYSSARLLMRYLLRHKDYKTEISQIPPLWHALEIKQKTGLFEDSQKCSWEAEETHDDKKENKKETNFILENVSLTK